MKKKSEITNQQILKAIQVLDKKVNKNSANLDKLAGAINIFADDNEGRFNGIDQRFEKIDQRFEKIDQRFEKIDQRFEKIDQRLNKIETTMVSKEYLDEKLLDLKGDLIVTIRKEDKKLGTLVKILENKKVISKKETQTIMSLEPFPNNT
ncbi:hypothetical protein KKH39_04710 [Patescibacteria group bacterium]|nr:hypothetical protein [Patescibacteria group bacterium]